MTEAERQHWDARYTSGHAPIHVEPHRWLVARAADVDALAANIRAESASRAGAPPQALDVACGAGATLLWLARRGWQVTGVDISAAALARAHSRIDAAGLLDRATLIGADLDGWRPQPQSCDLLTCFYFLDRRLWPALRAALRPQGLICLATYHRGRLVERPETNPAHLLEEGELAALLTSWGWRLLAAQIDARGEAVLGQRVA
jgi:SAM-dependent methyltransferase